MKKEAVRSRAWTAGGLCVAGLVSLVVFSGGASASWSLPGDAYQSLRYQPNDAYATWGNLTSNAGHLGISWTANPSTDDVAGPPPAVTEAGTNEPNTIINKQSPALGHATTAPVPPPDDFVSDPLPAILHLNVTRPVQVNLTIKGFSDNSWGYDPCVNYESATTSNLAFPEDFGPDPDLGVELYANDVLIGGAAHASSTEYEGTRYSPPGYSTCRFLMSPETSTIAAGAVLKLRVIHHSQSKNFQYALGPDHRSQIFLPAYSPEETFYRYPPSDGSGSGGVAGPAGTPSGPLTGPAAWAPIAGMGGGVIGVTRLMSLPNRRRGVAVVLTLTLALVGLAGCASPLGGGHAQGTKVPVGPSGSATSVIQSGAGTGLTQAGFGTILGQVHDDLHIPVGGAHVSVGGTNNFTDSDRRGQFELMNVPPGTYTLRIDRTDYHALETRVKVAAESVTRVDATLLPLSVKTANDRPHTHGYWNGADTRVAMDGSLGLRDGSPVYGFTLPGTAPGDTSGNPNTIIPGTYGIDVTVTWDKAAMGADRFGLEYEANDVPPDQYGNVPTRVLLPRESGVPFHIPTSWEMDDVGHQTFSSWRFQIYLSSLDAPAETAPQYYTNTLNQETGTAPTFSVHMVLHRGALPLEPAHPDHWAGATSLQVTPKTTTPQTPAYYSGTGQWAIFDAEAGGCLTNLYPNVNWMSYFSAYWGPPAKVVPQGTTWLEVTMKQNRASGSAGQGQFAWNLIYKGGNTPPAYYNFQSGQNPSYRAGPTATTSTDRLTTTWHVPVAPELADGIYNTKSVWNFIVTPDNLQNACMDVHLNAAGTPLSLTSWTVIAHQDAMPA